MKTLKSQVEEIKNIRGSKQSKINMLAKLGITKYEIGIILNDSNATVKKTATFGVEIECLVPRMDVTGRLEANFVPFEYQGYNHTDSKTIYKFVSDSSIRGENPIECVSPILSGRKGFDSLAACLTSLNEAGATVNRSTGLHVHVGAEELTDEQYVNVFANYKLLEEVIDSFMAKSRRANDSQWCASLRNHDFSDCTTIEDVRCELRYSRYHKVNAESYDRHNTVEFRQHQGSTDFTKIKNWVNFCIKLVEWSKDNRLTEPVRSIDEIPFLNKTEKRFFNKRAEALR